MKDVEFLESEIDFWILSILEKSAQKISKAKSNSEKIQIISDQLTGLEISNKYVEETLQEFPNPITIEFARILRKKSKPIIVAANKCDIDSAHDNIQKMKNEIKNLIPTSAEAEIALKKAAEKSIIKYSGENFQINNADEKQKQALEIINKRVIEKYGSTGIQKCLNEAVFSELNCIAVYPVANSNKFSDKDGNILPDVFLVQKGTTVKELAFKIHTSIGEKFVAGIDSRTKKKLGADYELKNNDVVEIAFAK
jgi:hypothetical protein